MFCFVYFFFAVPRLICYKLAAYFNKRKTIYKGKDDLYYVLNIKAESGSILSSSDLDALSIEFYTNGQEKAVFDLEDITEEGVLHVNATDLEVLPDGPMKARF